MRVFFQHPWKVAEEKKNFIKEASSLFVPDVPEVNSLMHNDPWVIEPPQTKKYSLRRIVPLFLLVAILLSTATVVVVMQKNQPEDIRSRAEDTDCQSTGYDSCDDYMKAMKLQSELNVKAGKGKTQSLARGDKTVKDPATGKDVKLKDLVKTLDPDKDPKALAKFDSATATADDRPAVTKEGQALQAAPAGGVATGAAPAAPAKVSQPSATCPGGYPEGTVAIGPGGGHVECKSTGLWKDTTALLNVIPVYIQQETRVNELLKLFKITDTTQIKVFTDTYNASLKDPALAKLTNGQKISLALDKAIEAKMSAVATGVSKDTTGLTEKEIAELAKTKTGVQPPGPMSQQKAVATYNELLKECSDRNAKEYNACKAQAIQTAFTGYSQEQALAIIAEDKKTQTVTTYKDLLKGCSDVTNAIDYETCDKRAQAKAFTGYTASQTKEIIAEVQKIERINSKIVGYYRYTGQYNSFGCTSGSTSQACKDLKANMDAVWANPDLKQIDKAKVDAEFTQYVYDTSKQQYFNAKLDYQTCIDSGVKNCPDKSGDVLASLSQQTGDNCSVGAQEECLQSQLKSEYASYKSLEASYNAPVTSADRQSEAYKDCMKDKKGNTLDCDMEYRQQHLISEKNVSTDLKNTIVVNYVQQQLAQISQGFSSERHALCSKLGGGTTCNTITGTDNYLTRYAQSLVSPYDSAVQQKILADLKVQQEKTKKVEADLAVLQIKYDPVMDALQDCLQNPAAAGRRYSCADQQSAVDKLLKTPEFQKYQTYIPTLEQNFAAQRGESYQSALAQTIGQRYVDAQLVVDKARSDYNACIGQNSVTECYGLKQNLDLKQKNLSVLTQSKGFTSLSAEAQAQIRANYDTYVAQQAAITDYSQLTVGVNECIRTNDNSSGCKGLSDLLNQFKTTNEVYKNADDKLKAQFESAATQYFDTEYLPNLLVKADTAKQQVDAAQIAYDLCANSLPDQGFADPSVACGKEANDLASANALYKGYQSDPLVTNFSKVEPLQTDYYTARFVYDTCTALDNTPSECAGSKTVYDKASSELYTNPVAAPYIHIVTSGYDQFVETSHPIVFADQAAQEAALKAMAPGLRAMGAWDLFYQQVQKGLIDPVEYKKNVWDPQAKFFKNPLSAIAIAYNTITNGYLLRNRAPNPNIYAEGRTAMFLQTQSDAQRALDLEAFKSSKTYQDWLHQNPELAKLPNAAEIAQKEKLEDYFREQGTYYASGYVRPETETAVLRQIVRGEVDPTSALKPIEDMKKNVLTNVMLDIREYLGPVFGLSSAYGWKLTSTSATDSQRDWAASLLSNQLKLDDPDAYNATLTKTMKDPEYLAWQSKPENQTKTAEDYFKEQLSGALKLQDSVSSPIGKLSGDLTDTSIEAQKQLATLFESDPNWLIRSVLNGTVSTTALQKSLIDAQIDTTALSGKVAGQMQEAVKQKIIDAQKDILAKAYQDSLPPEYQKQALSELKKNPAIADPEAYQLSQIKAFMDIGSAMNKMLQKEAGVIAPIEKALNGEFDFVAAQQMIEGNFINRIAWKVNEHYGGSLLSGRLTVLQGQQEWKSGQYLIAGWDVGRGLVQQVIQPVIDTLASLLLPVQLVRGVSAGISVWTMATQVANSYVAYKFASDTIANTMEVCSLQPGTGKQCVLDFAMSVAMSYGALGSTVNITKLIQSTVAKGAQTAGIVSLGSNVTGETLLNRANGLVQTAESMALKGTPSTVSQFMKGFVPVAFIAQGVNTCVTEGATLNCAVSLGMGLVSMGHLFTKAPVAPTSPAGLSSYEQSLLKSNQVLFTIMAGQTCIAALKGQVTGEQCAVAVLGAGLTYVQPGGKKGATTETEQLPVRPLEEVLKDVEAFNTAKAGEKVTIRGKQVEVPVDPVQQQKVATMLAEELVASAYNQGFLQGTVKVQAEEIQKTPEAERTAAQKDLLAKYETSFDQNGTLLSSLDATQVQDVLKASTAFRIEQEAAYESPRSTVQKITDAIQKVFNAEPAPVKELKVVQENFKKVALTSTVDSIEYQEALKRVNEAKVNVERINITSVKDIFAGPGRAAEVAVDEAAKARDQAASLNPDYIKESETVRALESDLQKAVENKNVTQRELDALEKTKPAQYEDILESAKTKAPEKLTPQETEALKYESAMKKFADADMQVQELTTKLSGAKQQAAEIQRRVSGGFDGLTISQAETELKTAQKKFTDLKTQAGVDPEAIKQAELTVRYHEVALDAVQKLDQAVAASKRALVIKAATETISRPINAIAKWRADRQAQRTIDATLRKEVGVNQKQMTKALSEGGSHLDAAAEAVKWRDTDRLVDDVNKIVDDLARNIDALSKKQTLIPDERTLLEAKQKEIAAAREELVALQDIQNRKAAGDIPKDIKPLMENPPKLREINPKTKLPFTVEEINSRIAQAKTTAGAISDTKSTAYLEAQNEVMRLQKQKILEEQIRALEGQSDLDSNQKRGKLETVERVSINLGNDQVNAYIENKILEHELKRSAIEGNLISLDSLQTRALLDVLRTDNVTIEFALAGGKTTIIAPIYMKVGVELYGRRGVIAAQEGQSRNVYDDIASTLTGDPTKKHTVTVKDANGNDVSYEVYDDVAIINQETIKDMPELAKTLKEAKYIVLDPNAAGFIKDQILQPGRTTEEYLAARTVNDILTKNVQAFVDEVHINFDPSKHQIINVGGESKLTSADQTAIKSVLNALEDIGVLEKGKSVSEKTGLVELQSTPDSTKKTLRLTKEAREKLQEHIVKETGLEADAVKRIFEDPLAEEARLETMTDASLKEKTTKALRMLEVVNEFDRQLGLSSGTDFAIRTDTKAGELPNAMIATDNAAQPDQRHSSTLTAGVFEALASTIDGRFDPNLIAVRAGGKSTRSSFADWVYDVRKDINSHLAAGSGTIGPTRGTLESVYGMAIRETKTVLERFFGMFGAQGEITNERIRGIGENTSNPDILRQNVLKYINDIKSETKTTKVHIVAGGGDLNSKEIFDLLVSEKSTYMGDESHTFYVMDAERNWTKYEVSADRKTITATPSSYKEAQNVLIAEGVKNTTVIGGMNSATGVNIYGDSSVIGIDLINTTTGRYQYDQSVARFNRKNNGQQAYVLVAGLPEGPIADRTVFRTMINDIEVTQNKINTYKALSAALETSATRPLKDIILNGKEGSLEVKLARDVLLEIQNPAEGKRYTVETGEQSPLEALQKQLEHIQSIYKEISPNGKYRMLYLALERTNRAALADITANAKSYTLSFTKDISQKIGTDAVFNVKNSGEFAKSFAKTIASDMLPEKVSRGIPEQKLLAEGAGDAGAKTPLTDEGVAAGQSVTPAAGGIAPLTLKQVVDQIPQLQRGEITIDQIGRVNVDNLFTQLKTLIRLPVLTGTRSTLQDQLNEQKEKLLPLSNAGLTFESRDIVITGDTPVSLSESGSLYRIFGERIHKATSNDLMDPTAQYVIVPDSLKNLDGISLNEAKQEADTQGTKIIEGLGKDTRVDKGGVVQKPIDDLNRQIAENEAAIS
ncbi:MAG: hypothetical protein UV63_C0011G0004, partial [Microgenomates group bacterium GW2011_GWC1_43_11]